jgi:predicted RNA-binding protein with PIN domain
MLYLIDGYNLLFRLVDSKKSLHNQRQEVIFSLQKEFAILGLKGIIVFDGHHFSNEQSGLSYYSPLTIAYSYRGQTADQYIIEHLAINDHPADITVITDDRFLLTESRLYHAHTLSLQSFICMLKKKHAQRIKKCKERHDARPFQESQHHAERLLKEFERRLMLYKAHSDDIDN